MGSNKLNDPPIALGFAQYVQNRVCDASKIGNNYNYKAWQEKSSNELCVIVNKSLQTWFFEAVMHKKIYFV
jgi:hypothetical protein